MVECIVFETSIKRIKSGRGSPSGKFRTSHHQIARGLSYHYNMVVARVLLVAIVWRGKIKEGLSDNKPKDSALLIVTELILSSRQSSLLLQ